MAPITSDGSSPHTRGALPGGLSAGGACGIIPAYAGSTPGVNLRGVSFTDHPRIRGEHYACTVVTKLGEGSSPHTRGAHHRVHRDGDRLGIIPAYAGSTFVPAAGGEPGDGSSPHTRGARGLRGPLDGSAGIIPAYAGSTSPTRPPSPTPTDHPRIRGEHIRRLSADVHTGGSSPHTRGARLMAWDARAKAGIIPAYAGSTRGHHKIQFDGKDHPRIRGEHLQDRPLWGRIPGSSPHTRGARVRGERERHIVRIIPAYAGSTWAYGRLWVSPADHPRIRGEHRGRELMPWQAYGSSPHTRGARRAECVYGVFRGIIPAYAGSTRSLPEGPRQGADHPRIRGEHFQMDDAICPRTGSSPHTRGARHERPRRRRHRRIIPAYAGSTARISPCFDWGRGSSPHTRGALPRRPLIFET